MNRQYSNKYKTDRLHGTYAGGNFVGGEVKDMALRNGAQYTGKVNAKVEPHGKGEMRLKDKVYQGMFREGMLDGSGVLVDGEKKHVGLFARNKAHGAGMRMLGGIRHIGNFNEGKAHGVFFVLGPLESVIMTYMDDKPQLLLAKFTHVSQYGHVC